MTMHDESGKVLPFLRPFEDHGVDFSGLVGVSQAKGTCPVCGKEKLYVNIKNGLWDCKSSSCAKYAGNTSSFLKMIHDVNFAETTLKDFKRLSELRGISVSSLRRNKMAWTGSYWILPVRNGQDKIVDLRKWRERGKLLSTAGCKLHLFKGNELAKYSGKEWVYLCEGEWDALRLENILKLNKVKGCVVAVPGAHNFKEEWRQLFKGHKVRLCYDADEAGDQGLEKCYKKLLGTASKLECIQWSDTLPSGFDVRDYFAQEKSLKKFTTLFAPYPRTLPAEEKKAEPILKIKTWEGIKKVFGKYFRMTPDLEDTLKIVLATTLTTPMEGDPLWVFIVSPPGGMKSEILMSVSECDIAVCRSSITPKTLVSGYKGEDASLIPKLDGKIFVLKDYTEIKSMHPNAQQEIFGTLRGAYDGVVQYQFGNAVLRTYKCHFNMVAGVTPVIHGDNQASLGERFLKFSIPKASEQVENEMIASAMGNVGKEKRVHTRVRSAVRSFLERKLARKLKEIKVPSSVRNDIISMSKCVAMLRATVERNQRTDALMYRPQYEVATRLGKQLLKLWYGLYLVDPSAKQEENLRLLKKVARDTAVGFNIEICETMSAVRRSITVQDLSQKSGIPTTTLRSKLEDMYSLQLIRKFQRESTKPGPNPVAWKMGRRLRECYQEAFGKG